jgi:peptide-methionine (S)-S-oxide reductase
VVDRAGAGAAVRGSGRAPRAAFGARKAASPLHVAEDYHRDYWKKNLIRYRFYRPGCGRDQRLEQIQGKDAMLSLLGGGG